jgi:uncharacterized membrane protein
MPTYARDTVIDVDADRLFDYLSDVAHLPQYFARMRSAHLVGDDEVHTTAVIEVPDQGTREVEGTAWFRRDPDAKRIEWGSEGQNNYHGRLTVSTSHDSARVVLEIHTESSHDGIDAAIDESLAALESAVTGA